MRPATRRAVVGAVSVSAVLLPAVGMIYLGVVSYSSDRGAVASKVDEQLRTTQRVARAVEEELRGALNAAEELAGGSPPDAAALRRLAREHPAAAAPFFLGPAGHLVWPRSQPLDAAIPEPVPARAPRACPEAQFDHCVREIRATRARARQLESARNRELAACPRDRCAADARVLQRVRRAYLSLARFADTGPAAVLGLARLDRLSGDERKAAQRYRELVQRFGARQDEEGVSYAFLGELGEAELTGNVAHLAAIYARLLGGRYAGTPEAHFALARHVSHRLARAELGALTAAKVIALDARLAALQDEARFARSLGPELEDVARSASTQARGRAALDGSPRTVIFRRTSGGGVVGLIVPNRRVGTMAARALERQGRAQRRWTRIHGIGHLPEDPRLRTLATASFGPLLPHIGLSLVNPVSEPDPLDVIVSAQSRRHLWLSGGLALVLVLGILATVRGAARERELASLKSDFVSTVSHELKTPLTSVRMFAEMLQQGVARGDDERQSRYHDIIVKESERLGLLIANLLDYSQVERGTRRYAELSLPARNLAEEAVSTFSRLQEPHGAQVHTADDSGGDAHVRVDREVIVQCILNLLSNATKYGGPDPIRVAVTATTEWVTIAVHDRGPGIPRAELSKIWDEFYRAPSAYNSGVEGTGLGLALVKRHVEAHEGRVRVKSTAGEGTSFAIDLPRANAPAKDMD